MGEKLERNAQRLLLQRLSDSYPNRVDYNDLVPLVEGTGLNVNLAYLAEHGLVRLAKPEYLDDRNPYAGATISARGLDFLAGDGGLGAILGVVTVRLHDDTLRQLLIDRVEESPGDETVKQKIVAQLKSMPADAMKTLAEQATLAAVRQMPNALQWLNSTLFGS